MTPRQFIDQLYLSLLEQGWKLSDIDEMDVFYYLHLLKVKAKTQQTYIDDVL
ncbi:hypothetical protein [Salisediminibacterium selenitireducens]|uniref:Uncharacterized protein n=1 Tax=Bacillus selenitireducens (strain ATCC 700615 / DSM 15326 / MLS10) TaxID=439292 RepID=D6XZF5_BACIE|nr:hypothetical protein [Salisediminibacterium selenitireducens]ADH98329.1 hypothetical protein Bsel_0800 [[Bacillus] selenitireducens MLS10]